MAQPDHKLIHAFGALAELGQEITNKNSFQETIRTSLHLISGALGIMRCAVARYSRFAHELNIIAVRGMGDDLPLAFSLCPEDERQFLTNGIGAIEVREARVLPFFQVYDATFERRRLELLIPLVVRDEIVGAVFLGEKATGEPYTTYEKDIVCAMGRHVAVAITQRNLMAEVERRAEENRQLFDEMRSTYHDTVKAFAAAIDCKDKYTEGHSVRVGKFTEIIASEIGWSSDEVEGAAVAGYLHDVGKLTVERKIINAPYRINAKESVELNRHPAVGFEILQPINHPFADVPLAAKYHHERMDGRGYPHGLVGGEIPPIAKIVSLADSFDAMTTDRPYKARRQAKDVVDDLKNNAGKQFAPELVTAFLGGMLKELKGEDRNRRFRRLLGREYMETEGLTDKLRYTLNDLASTTSMTFVASASAGEMPIL